MSRFAAFWLVIISLVSTSFSAHAEINPFKKAKKYNFGNEIAWYFKDGAALKSGSHRDGSDTNYYHLNITTHRLRLRLSKNDPSGELENTRSLDQVDIIDVLVDGQRMPRFQWCLDNQARPADYLKYSSIVINDVCVNRGDGDFIIELDGATKNMLSRASSLDFIIEPYGRPVRLNFSLGNFADIMAKVDRPEPPPVVKPAPVVEAKPKPAPPAPKPVKKVIKTCDANPPAEFKAEVKVITYNCDDNTAKSRAIASINRSVEAIKQKRLAEEAERKRLAEERAALEAANKQVEEAWEQQQAEIWVQRCQKHWSKGVSPCYCEKYLDQAPPGVNNTCGR